MIKKIVLILLLFFLFSTKSYAVLISETGSLNSSPIGTSFLELETIGGLSEHTTIQNIFTSILGSSYDTSVELDALFNARCLESVFGTAISTGLLLDGTDLKVSAILQEYHTVDPSAYMLGLFDDANEATLKASINLEVGVDFNAYDADLTTWAGITPGANVGAFLATPSSANFASALTGETGSGAAVFGTSPAFTTSFTLDNGFLVQPALGTTGHTYGMQAYGSGGAVTWLSVANDTGDTNPNVTIANCDLTLPSITSAAFGSDPADTGAIRLSNASYIYSEADAAGTDVSVIGVDSGEIVQIGASGASGVTITPAVTCTSTVSSNGAVPDAADGAALGSAALEWSDLYLAAGGVIYGEADQSNTLTSSATGWTANLDLTITGNDLNIGADYADTGDLNLSNAGVIAWEDDTEITLIHVDNTGLALNGSFDITAAGGLILSNDETITNGTDGTITMGGDIVATGDEIRCAGAASPYLALQDSDAAGAEYTDEQTVKIYAQQTTTIEDGEIGDFRIAAVGAGTAGTWYTHVFWDGSADTLSLGTLTDADAPAAVADNEDLVLDFDTANDNEVTVSTDSGATDIRTTLQITDTKKITADADNETMTILQLGQVWTNTGDADGTIFTLPEASTWIGKSVTFFLTVAQTLTINPNDANDTILYLGCSAGDAIQADAVGESITVMAIDATNIAVFGPAGTWTDVN